MSRRAKPKQYIRDQDQDQGSNPQDQDQDQDGENTVPRLETVCLETSYHFLFDTHVAHVNVVHLRNVHLTNYNSIDN